MYFLAKRRKANFEDGCKIIAIYQRNLVEKNISQQTKQLYFGIRINPIQAGHSLAWFFLALSVPGLFNSSLRREFFRLRSPGSYPEQRLVMKPSEQQSSSGIYRRRSIFVAL